MTTTLQQPRGQQSEYVTEDGELLEQIIDQASTAKVDPREAAFTEAQLDTAVKRPRSIKLFMQRALTYATEDKEVAASCTYAVPRGGKTITGPSVRLAEICVLAWGNLHVEGRIVEIGDQFVKVAGTAWDMETNNRISQETTRRITDKQNRRFNDDMIIVTANAAISIILRNAIFRIIPKSLVEKIRTQAAKVALGDATSLEARRSEAVAFWEKQGVKQDRLLAALGKPGLQDIGLDEIQLLLGFWTAIKDKQTTIEECFPSLQTKSQTLAEKIKGGKKDDADSSQEQPEMKPAASEEQAKATEQAEVQTQDQPPKPMPLRPATLTKIQEILSKLGMAENTYRATIKIKKWNELLEQDALAHLKDLETALAQKQREPGDED
jgi:hypothetical protein